MMVEYIAKPEAGMLLMTRFLHELGLSKRECMFCCNQSSLDLSKRTVYNIRIKHIDVWYHWLCIAIERKINKHVV